MGQQASVRTHLTIKLIDIINELPTKLTDVYGRTDGMFRLAFIVCSSSLYIAIVLCVVHRSRNHAMTNEPHYDI